MEEEESVVLGEVCGRVKSSKRSARRGWCMWRFVIEESLLWFALLVWVCLLRWGRRRGYHFCGGVVYFLDGVYRWMKMKMESHRLILPVYSI